MTTGGVRATPQLGTEELEKISKRVEQEFPNDPALQQIHIARKILSRQAELLGLDFLDYVAQVVIRVREKH